MEPAVSLGAVWRAGALTGAAAAQVGVFSMGQDGLSAVENPSELFLRERSGAGVSSAVTVTMEGSRPLLLEVQGLCSPAQQARPWP